MIKFDGQNLTTDDMAFAVVLLCHGFNPLVERGDSGVIWSLAPDEIEDNDMSDFIIDYKRGALRVEPRRFVREWTAVRKDVYRLMEVSKSAKGSPVPRRAADGAGI